MASTPVRSVMSAGSYAGPSISSRRARSSPVWSSSPSRSPNCWYSTCRLTSAASAISDTGTAVVPRSVTRAIAARINADRERRTLRSMGGRGVDDSAGSGFMTTIMDTCQ